MAAMVSRDGLERHVLLAGDRYRRGPASLHRATQNGPAGPLMARRLCRHANCLRSMNFGSSRLSGEGRLDFQKKVF
jgi:hypothetical protein